jgi:hypothetical protein
VLNHPGQHTLGVHPEGLTLGIVGLDGEGAGTDDVGVDPWDTQQPSS